MALAIDIGILAGTLCYVVHFPARPARGARYVTYRIRRGLGQLAHKRPSQASRIGRRACTTASTASIDPENLSGTATNEWFEAGLGALTLGNEILRLRHWLASARTARARCGRSVTPWSVVHAFPSPGPSRPRRDARPPLRGWPRSIPGRSTPAAAPGRASLGALEEINVFFSRIPGS